ncbi:uncharacterized protein G2W53_019906 [Senna tora]|uniref:CTLH domain-containing protein n=1 Tax=Senna tora TaxID=362788 RepID=A0A834WMT3_9FABA|nr:uncharacterized protein G2W53_019906 [Senna tora]
MDTTSTPVNWEALDTIILDFAISEHLIVHSSSPSASTSSSSYHSRFIIRHIRRSLESGDIDAAINLLHRHAPSILHDHRFLFRLQKQKFIELLRKGTTEDRDSAIDCVRTALAPCALDAYPEAYEEFKHVLLAFIYDKDDQSSPVANEWSERRRFELAGLMSSVLRAHLHAYDPIFPMALRYLISIHRAYCSHQGVVSSISDLTERLLLEEHDPPATPQDTFYEVPPFDEVDIQALAHAVELTRQGAIDSLKFAKGDLFQAFQNELCRMRLDIPLLDQLVHEYCVYRGIVDSGMHSDGETCVTNAHMDTSPENKSDVTSMQGIDVEVRYASELTSNHEDCSTSASQQLENPRVLQRGRLHGNGERSKRKQWRGRYDDTNYIPDASLEEHSKQEESISTIVSKMLKEKQGSEMHSVFDINNMKDKFEILFRMKELTNKGMAAEVVDEVNDIDPNFFVKNSNLLFQLRQVEFLKLVSSGDLNAALRVACSHLGPLAASDPALLKPLKETLLALLRPNEDALGNNLPLHALAASLQMAVGRGLGVEEPQLMKIMRATVYTHNEWFKLQMYKDRFEGLLRIDSLKEVNTSTSFLSAVSSCTRMSEDGSSPVQVSSTDAICDESSILKVMSVELACLIKAINKHVMFLVISVIDFLTFLSLDYGNAISGISNFFPL